MKDTSLMRALSAVPTTQCVCARMCVCVCVYACVLVSCVYACVRVALCYHVSIWWLVLSLTTQSKGHATQLQYTIVALCRCTLLLRPRSITYHLKYSHHYSCSVRLNCIRIFIFIKCVMYLYYKCSLCAFSHLISESCRSDSCTKHCANETHRPSKGWRG